jgi:hypothetical protein
VPAQEYVLQLLRAPSEQITVHSALKKHRGLSASNPYLQPSSMTYEVTIWPADLADRVMRTATTIASEWIEDLPRIGPRSACLRSHPGLLRSPHRGLLTLYVFPSPNPSCSMHGANLWPQSHRVGQADLRGRYV